MQTREMRLLIGHLETLAGRIRDGLDNANWANQQKLISILVKRVEVGEEEVRPVY